ncbi:efflux RND transporter periplasmic adaptor subunit [Chitinophaga niabensis]|uniref:Barrel-sandwich domain of CusB or HlyD membrane-fusion n=1 Tax=Chitinophaga niabensis TaxID=536979 RepID=A0A1N6JQ72_9BACT|nr:HlyD family efflux transporter periplasmic adaptor subunit [Chitinophaga niabensis]SIO46411.1 Barrel-sandwich domain of CusB or HlyD membrane-fusion [Chitinophaga niabensis]
MALSRFILASFVLLAMQGCGPKAPDAATAGAEANSEAAGTPVTVTSPGIEDMQDVITLNAVSSFLLKTPVRSSANGYLQKVYTQPGRFVNAGQDLFVIRTKESQSLGNTISGLDSSLHFDGLIHVKAPGSGYVTGLSYRPGDYVLDGEQLATISDAKSFVFLLNLPYELKPFIPANKQLTLQLPDSTSLTGYLDIAMPALDSASQTQSYKLRVNTNMDIPENLIAKVMLLKKTSPHTVTLPKGAVLSDEMQRVFWIMKMIDSTTAVKTIIAKGMETATTVEILSPKLSATDKVLLTGNYGLPDTAKVLITQQP